jgi:DNA-binding transcriptional LysR family regulator
VLLNRLQARARLRHLQVLVKLAELGSLKRAAEALGLSQPAVTQLLADLERLVELPLFERHARGVRLAPAGERLLPLTRRMLDQLAEGAEVLAAMKQQGEGVVRVVGITGAIAGWMVQALPEFARRHPGIQVQLRECDVDQWALHLARGEADLAACRFTPVPPTGHVFVPLIEDRFVVACGPAHPLAGQRDVPWTTLARETWVPSPVGSSARRVFEEQMAALGREPRLHPVVTRVLLMTWALLQADRLLTLVPYGVVRQLVEGGQLALVHTQPDLPFQALGLMVPQAGLSSATRTFIEDMRDYARTQPGSVVAADPA